MKTAIAFALLGLTASAAPLTAPSSSTSPSPSPSPSPSTSTASSSPDFFNRHINGKLTSAWCNPPHTSNYDAAVLSSEIASYCAPNSAHSRAKVHPLDGEGGYYLATDGGDEGAEKGGEECETALSWIAEKCAPEGKTGVYRVEGVVYFFGRTGETGMRPAP